MVAVLVFAVCVGFTGWTLIGYPLLLAVLGRLRAARLAPHQMPADAPRVSVLLPVANGEKWLAAKLESILALDYPNSRLEILVASDGSTDGTDLIAREFASRHSNIRFFPVPRGGKARALNALMPHASGDILFFTDVRQKLDRRCLAMLVAPFSEPQVGGVCGELIIRDGETQEEQSVGLYWKLEKWIRRQLSRAGTLLVVTGCLYAIRRELAEPLPANALGDDIFMPQAVLRKGRRVVFEDRARAYDYPTTRDVEFGRKVRTLAALYQYVGRHGLGPHPFHFFCYKVSRVLLPWALLTAAIATPFLPSPWHIVAGIGQVLLYGAALLDPFVADSWSVKRITSPARTFCMLMLAALFAASILFRPAETLWRPTVVRHPRTTGSTAAGELP